MTDSARRIENLQARRLRMLDYLKLKTEEADWHGVQDAASDLRDIESEIKGLEYGR